jgi:hypothetical protein
VTQRLSRGVNGASERSINRVANAVRKIMGIDEVLPRLQLVARIGQVAGNLPAKLGELRTKQRE